MLASLTVCRTLSNSAHMSKLLCYRRQGGTVSYDRITCCALRNSPRIGIGCMGEPPRCFLNQRPLSSAFLHQALLLRRIHSNESGVEQVALRGSRIRELFHKAVERRR